MKSKMLFACAAIATFVFAAGGQYAFADNGFSDGPELDDPPIIVDVDWFASAATPPAFFWGGPPGVFNSEGPFTYRAPRKMMRLT